MEEYSEQRRMRSFFALRTGLKETMNAYQANIDADKKMKILYRGDVLAKHLRLTFLGIAVIYLGISYFIYEDIYVNALPVYSMIFRLLPVAAASVLLMVIVTPLRSRSALVIFVYYACLGCLMAMMAGLLVITVSTRRYEQYVLGTVVVIFAVYLCNLYGMKYLVPVYFIPLGAAVTALLARGDVPLGKVTILSNPIIISFVCSLLARTQHMIRFRDFSNAIFIEGKNKMLNNELLLAKSVQSRMMPVITPQIRDTDIAAVYSPVIGIGGDLYDYIEYGSRDSLGIFVCDVSGHGVSAALISSMVKANINNCRRTEPTPRGLLKSLNEQLVGQISNHFVTAFYGKLSMKERTFIYSRGGHNHPLLAREGQVTELEGRGKLLGVVSGLEFEEREQKLMKGDRIVLYTDGLIEARNRDGDIFGEGRLIDAVREFSSLSSEHFVRALHQRAREYQYRQAFEDDVCIISVYLK